MGLLRHTMASRILTQLGGLAVLAFAPALSLDNGVGRTPALGWSSWNYVQDNVNQTFIHGIADALVSTGLRDAGYEYVNLDAGVWLPSRTNSTGELQPDPDKFPDGSVALALLNREDHGSVSLEVGWQGIGLPVGASCAVRDLLAQTDLPKSVGSYNKEVNSH